MMNLTSSDGNKYFWRTTKNPRQLLSLKPPPEYPHLRSIIAFFVCRICNCSIHHKLLIVLAKTYGTQKIENHDKTIVTYKETKIIEGRYIRCSTSYIRNRRSIHTSLNELHTPLNALHTPLNALHTTLPVPGLQSPVSGQDFAICLQ